MSSSIEKALAIITDALQAFLNEPDIRGCKQCGTPWTGLRDAECNPVCAWCGARVAAADVVGTRIELDAAKTGVTGLEKQGMNGSDSTRYDSEAMAADIAGAIGEAMNAEIGETYSRSYGHAFNLVTPRGLKFTVTVTEEENPS